MIISRLKEASRARRQILDLHEREREVLDALISCRSIVKGSVYELKTRCGKPACCCARGERHGAMVLSWSEQGRTKLMTVQRDDLDRLIKLTEEYKTFRKARARLVKLHKELLKAVDSLEATIREAPART